MLDDLQSKKEWAQVLASRAEPKPENTPLPTVCEKCGSDALGHGNQASKCRACGHIMQRVQIDFNQLPEELATETKEFNRDWLKSRGRS